MRTKDRLKRLSGARDRLREIGDAEMSIDEIAKATAMSRFHFIRQFKAVFGETPSRFRTRARLERARQLLVATDDSITNVCLEIGFTSLGSFCSLFAARFGQTPTAYRNAHRGSAGDAAPACMSILHAAWTKTAQITRSRQTADRVT